MTCFIADVIINVRILTLDKTTTQFSFADQALRMNPVIRTGHVRANPQNGQNGAGNASHSVESSLFVAWNIPSSEVYDRGNEPAMRKQELHTSPIFGIGMNRALVRGTFDVDHSRQHYRSTSEYLQPCNC
eukprot:SAG31_NODE_19525_length_599_cov_1.314000_1_plen_130_part_00